MLGGPGLPSVCMSGPVCCAARGEVSVGGWGGSDWLGVWDAHLNLFNQTGEGVGIGGAAADPQYNFLTQFLSDNDEDNISDTLFFNTNLSPYQDVNINCSYIQTDELIQKISPSKFSIISLNVQSLNAKFDSLNSLINELSSTNQNPDVICLQETWDIKDSSMFHINNYHPIELNLRSSAKGGGVAIYVKNNLNFKRLPQFSLCVDRILEALFVEIITPENKKIIVGSVYRPGTKHPQLTFTEQYSQFSELFSNLLANVSGQSDNVYIYGDFNLDVLKVTENKFIANYVDTIFSFGFLQLVLNPTRISNNSATLIDHILTNSVSNDYDSYIICLDISDHFAILHQLNFDKPKLLPFMADTRNFSAENIKRFKTAMNSYNWDHVMSVNCTQAAYNNFITTFTALFNAFFPIKKTKFNRNFNSIEPWMSGGILTSRRQKNTLYAASLRSPSTTSKNTYKIYRNLYNVVIRNEKKLYYERQIKLHQNNLRKTWQILFSAIRRNTRSNRGCTEITVDGLQIRDPILMATHFNKFFVNMASDTVKNINPSPKSPTVKIRQNLNSFNLSRNPITPSEILDATKMLVDKKTPDLNGISSNFIKQIIFTIINPIHHIFNLSITNGVVPSQLKIAKIVPIFKSGLKTNIDNYRPISLLSTFSKILEKIIAARLTIFLNNSDILSSWQFGF